MELNIDTLTKIFDKYGKEPSLEIKEQEPAAASTPSTPSSGASSGKSPKKWESGISRGKSNPIGNTVWSSGRKFGKTYMNDVKYVWKSDRVMGKTGGSDYA